MMIDSNANRADTSKVELNGLPYRGHSLPSRKVMNMKLALVGYGRMGRQVEELARRHGHEIVARIDPVAKNASGAEITAKAVAKAEVCIEFTRPDTAADNLVRLCELSARVVSGTTGWYDRLDEVAAAADANKAAVLYGANFSVGVNLFFRLVERAAELFGDLPERDLFVTEAHHRGKVDAPSGTARRLAEIILGKASSKSAALTQNPDGRIADDALQVASIRAGWIPGTHRVGIESPHDSIVIEHQARSREGFAEGAVRGAEWLIDAPPGLYRFEDVLDEILS